MIDAATAMTAIFLRSKLAGLAAAGVTTAKVKDRRTGRVRDVSLRSLDAAIGDVIDAVWEPPAPSCIHCNRSDVPLRVLRTEPRLEHVCADCHSPSAYGPEDCGGAQAVPEWDDLPAAGAGR